MIHCILNWNNSKVSKSFTTNNCKSNWHIHVDGFCSFGMAPPYNQMMYDYWLFCWAFKRVSFRNDSNSLIFLWGKLLHNSTQQMIINVIWCQLAMFCCVWHHRLYASMIVLIFHKKRIHKWFISPSSFFNDIISFCCFHHCRIIVISLIIERVASSTKLLSGLALCSKCKSWFCKESYSSSGLPSSK